MSKTASGNRKKQTDLLEKLAQLDLSEIDFKNAGSWPRMGKIAAWITVGMLTALAVYLLYLSPKLTQLEQSKNQEKQLLTEFELKAFQGANLSAYKQQMEKIQQQITQLSAQLPTEKLIPELIEQIGEQALKNRVDIRGLQLQPERQESAYSAQPLTLTVSGNFHNLAHFLSGLTQLERIVTLHDFTLQPDGRHLILIVEATAYHNTPSEKEEDRE